MNAELRDNLIELSSRRANVGFFIAIHKLEILFDCFRIGKMIEDSVRLGGLDPNFIN